MVALRSAQTPSAARKWALWACVASAVVLVVAWVDGGEEPLHAIEQAVAVSGEGKA